MSETVERKFAADGDPPFHYTEITTWCDSCGEAVEVVRIPWYGHLSSGWRRQHKCPKGGVEQDFNGEFLPAQPEEGKP